MRVSAVWSLALGVLHLWECPRHHPRAGLWLKLAWFAESHMMSFRVCQVGARDSVAAEPGSLAWPGLGRTPLPFCGEDGEAEKQDAEQAGKD